MRKGNKLIKEGKVPKKRTLNTQVLTDIVNGYYLDGIEAGYKAGYDYGYEVGKKDYDQNNKQFDLGYKSGIENGYQQGLEDGRKQGVAIDGDKRYWEGYHAAQEDGQKIYQKGLDDAWTAAFKVIAIPTEKRIEIFGTGFFSDIRSMGAEAIEKIQEYEEKQRQEEAIERFREKLESGYFSGKQKQSCDNCIHNDKEWHSEPCDGCTLSDSHYVSASDPIESEKTVYPDNPCDLCRFNPPSSFDGKPCTMCPAEGRSNEQ